MADPALRWSLDLARFDAHEKARVVSLLKKLERDLVAKVAAGTDWSKARIARQIAEANFVVQQYYDSIALHSADTAAQLARVSAVAASAPLAAMAETASILPTEAAMRALISDAVIMGAPQASWWKRQAADVAFRFATAVRQGVAAAETNQQIIRRVRSEMDVTRRNAASLVQTSVQTVANEARMASFQANSDVVQGVRWLSALDSRVCARCGALDGMTWKLDGTPITAIKPLLNPPLHFNDRCVLTPITRFSELGKGQRASDQGPVDRKITFEEFLERQGRAYQEDVLGKGRAEMWADGKITLADLTNGQGRPLTLAQLRSKYE